MSLLPCMRDGGVLVRPYLLRMQPAPLPTRRHIRVWKLRQTVVPVLGAGAMGEAAQTDETILVVHNTYSST